MSGPTTQDGYDFAMHEGRVLVERLANTYPTVPRALTEGGQNSADAGAKWVLIGIDQKDACAVILDDGVGISPDFFARALQSVGQGIKGEKSMGRFGLGMVSPVNKCKRYRLISRPRGSALIREWLFEGEKLRRKKKIGKIPSRLLPSFPEVPVAFREVVAASGIQWRTMALMTDVTRDRAVSEVTIEGLAGHIRSKLGRGMRRNGTIVHLIIRDENGKIAQKEINPLNYEGEPLEVVTIEEALCGKVEFRLFRAPKGESPGVNVLQMGDNSSISFMDFWRQANGSQWLQNEGIKAAFDALKSGFFEGDIQIENVELDADRESFKMGDNLRASYIAILRWYSEYGHKEYQQEKQARRNDRWRNLGEQSLQRLYDLIGSNSSFAAIAPMFTTVIEERLNSTVTGKQGGVSGGSRVTARHPSDKPKQAGSSSVPKPRDPRGKDRQPEEREPTKLKYQYENMLDSTELWVFDFDTGTIIINVRHFLWAACDETDGKRTSKNDRQIMRLQEWIAMKVLRLLVRYPDPVDFEMARGEIDEEVALFVHGFILV